MRNLDIIAQELFNKIRGRFPSVTIGNSEGKVTNVPKEARYYDFDFKEGDRNLGKVSISLDENDVAVMYSNDFVTQEDTITKNSCLKRRNKLFWSSQESNWPDKDLNS